MCIRDSVNAALENEEIIKGYIKCRTKGGMIVDVFGIEAFLPGSQIDVKPIRDYDGATITWQARIPTTWWKTPARRTRPDLHSDPSRT